MKPFQRFFPAALLSAIALAALVAAPPAALSDDDSPPTAYDGAGDARSFASALLAHALAVLPHEKIGMTGTLTVRRQRGKVLAERDFTMWLDYGTDTPRATYEVRDAFGRVEDRLSLSRSSGEAAARIELVRGDPPEPAPTPPLNARVGGTDLTWMDITLDFLWWTDAIYEGEESVKGRDCHVVVASPPEPIPGCIAVRLWLDKEVGFVMRAEQLGPQGDPTRRMWVQSVRQVRGRWIIGTMEIESLGSDHRTRLKVEDWLQP